MKVKVLEMFKDKHTGDIYNVGDTLELTKERVEELEAHPKKLIKRVKTTTTKKAKKDE